MHSCSSTLLVRGRYVLKGQNDGYPLYQSLSTSAQQLYMERADAAWRLAVMGKQVYVVQVLWFTSLGDEPANTSAAQLQQRR